MSRLPKAAATPSAGVRITVQVTPRASANSVETLEDGSVRVRVTAAPVDGAANDAVARVLAGALGIAPGRLTILVGATARRKIVQVSDLTPEQVAVRLRKIRRPSTGSLRP